MLQLAGVVLSILALGVSWQAYRNSVVARKDARAISGLDLRPTIGLNTQFTKIAGMPPHYIVSNNGPVDALQLEVQLISHRYHKNVDAIKISVTGTDQRKVVPKVPPLSSIAFRFPDLWLDENARIEQPPEHNVMEIRISYRRPPDMTQYIETAIYFINKEGYWVPENSSSLDKATYEPIKKAMYAKLKQSDRYMRGTLRSDILHPVER